MSASSSTGIDIASTLAVELKDILKVKGLHPTDEWMSQFLSTQRLTTPSAALASTAAFRLLASNITQTLSADSTATFPTDLQDVTSKERRLPRGDLVVQILDVEDMGRSRWEQIEALEAIERGEGSKGREIIRLEQNEADGEDQNPALRPTSMTAANFQKSRGPHKLLMQDVAGGTAFGIEMEGIDQLGMGMDLGAKMLIRGAVVARGVVLLHSSSVSWLGGRIETLDHIWKKEKKQRLLATINSQE